ncbi:hypothetical protein ACVW00_001346 [Marmoricola sp. URHA0025 HA25]
MSRFISGGNAVRLIVVLVVVAAALSLSRLDSQEASPSPTSEADVAPVVQPLEAGTTLVPAAVPLPAPAPTATHPRHRHHAHGRHARPHRHHRKHRSARRARVHHKAHHPHRIRGAGRDIGWPQCPRDVGFRGRNGLGQPMPDEGVRFVIVGLTNGRAFTPNPCLDRHLAWVRSHHVYAAAYAFATYPTRTQLRHYRHSGPYDGGTRLGALGNAGHSAARYNIRVMQRHGFTTPHVWLDLEPSSSRPWSGRHSWNGAVVRGWVRAYREAGYGVGFYSTTSLWSHIAGRLRFGLPEWRTAGPVSPAGALRRCSDGGFQGGPAVIAQWWTTHRDLDRICPGPSRAATLERYFHKW